MSEAAIHLERMVERRTRDTQWATRQEILVCVGAALGFAAVLAWRLAPRPGLEVGSALGVILAWCGFTVLRFRAVLWGQLPERPGATGLAHYRAVLERRREHLRNAWLWQGPLVLACVTLVAVIVRQAAGSLARWRNMLPFLVLLAVWIVLGIAMRGRRAAELQREIDEWGPAAEQAVNPPAV